MHKLLVAALGVASASAHLSAASAQAGPWTRWGNSVSVCDNKTHSIRMFGTYPQKRDAPDALHTIQAQESSSAEFQLQWEGPGNPRLISAGLNRFDEQFDRPGWSIRVSVDGRVVPIEREEESDPEDGPWWGPASKKDWISMLRGARLVKAEFLDSSGRVAGSRTFDLAQARKVAASELQGAGWRCP